VVCTESTNSEIQEDVSTPDHEDKSNTLVESSHYQTLRRRLFLTDQGISTRCRTEGTAGELSQPYLQCFQSHLSDGAVEFFRQCVYFRPVWFFRETQIQNLTSHPNPR